MSEVTKRQYEAMFLFDPTFATPFENCEREIRRIFERAEAEILICQLWDERRLAFKVEGRKRGVYVLTYFLAPPNKIKSLERDAWLSEHILRILVLNADHLTREAMQHWAGEHRPERADEREDENGRGGDEERHRDSRRRESREPRERRGPRPGAPAPAEPAALEG